MRVRAYLAKGEEGGLLKSDCRSEKATRKKGSRRDCCFWMASACKHASGLNFANFGWKWLRNPDFSPETQNSVVWLVCVILLKGYEMPKTGAKSSYLSWHSAIWKQTVHKLSSTAPTWRGKRYRRSLRATHHIWAGDCTLWLMESGLPIVQMRSAMGWIDNTVYSSRWSLLDQFLTYAQLHLNDALTKSPM